MGRCADCWTTKAATNHLEEQSTNPVGWLVRGWLVGWLSTRACLKNRLPLPRACAPSACNVSASGTVQTRRCGRRPINFLGLEAAHTNIYCQPGNQFLAIWLLGGAGARGTSPNPSAPSVCPISPPTTHPLTTHLHTSLTTYSIETVPTLTIWCPSARRWPLRCASPRRCTRRTG